MTLTIVDPRAATKVADLCEGEAVGVLRGKRIGLRQDEFWRCWEWVTDEWAALLEAEGAEVVLWRAPVSKATEARRASQSFSDFLGSIDAGIFGLCNCGSCSLWAVHDAVRSLDCGLPTLITATAQFERLARALASRRGRTNLRLTVLPYPLEGRPEDDVRAIARERFEDMLETFGARR